MAAWLLADQAEANARDNRGATPLHSAAYNNHQGVMELLLAHQADVNAKDNNGSRPLHYGGAE